MNITGNTVDDVCDTYNVIMEYLMNFMINNMDNMQYIYLYFPFCGKELGKEEHILKMLEKIMIDNVLGYQIIIIFADPRLTEENIPDRFKNFKYYLFNFFVDINNLEMPLGKMFIVSYGYQHTIFYRQKELEKITGKFDKLEKILKNNYF